MNRQQDMCQNKASERKYPEVTGHHKEVWVMLLFLFKFIYTFKFSY